MHCLLPLVWSAFLGEEPSHPYMVAPPPPLALWHPPAPPSDTPQLCGDSYPYHQETTHFTIQWEDPTIDTARVEAIASYLEQAWTVLVEQQGFPAPVSSDACYMWFILDPALSGSGYTTLYYNDTYPEGYPVSWLSPDYYSEEYPDFALSVAVHEFVHMLQYGLDDWGDEAGMWYWEASAEWGAEIGAPELNMYAISTYWLARGTKLDFDTMANSHQYGMVALSAWMDENFGPDVFVESWLTARDNPGLGWDTRLSAVSGEDFASIMLGFWGDYVTGGLRESSLYYAPLRYDSLEEIPVEETISAPGVWGAHLIDFQVAGEIAATEPMVVMYVQGSEWSMEPFEEGPFTGVFIAPEAVPGFFSFGSPQDSAGDSALDSAGDSGKKEPPRACGCDSTGGVGSVVGLLWLVMAGKCRGGRRR